MSDVRRNRPDPAAELPFDLSPVDLSVSLGSHLPIRVLDRWSRSKNISYRRPDWALETTAAVLPVQAFLSWLNEPVGLSGGVGEGFLPDGFILGFIHGLSA